MPKDTHFLVTVATDGKTSVRAGYDEQWGKSQAASQNAQMRDSQITYMLDNSHLETVQKMAKSGATQDEISKYAREHGTAPGYAPQDLAANLNAFREKRERLAQGRSAHELGENSPGNAASATMAIRALLR